MDFNHKFDKTSITIHNPQFKFHNSQFQNHISAFHIPIEELASDHLHNSFPRFIRSDICRSKANTLHVPKSGSRIITVAN